MNRRSFLKAAAVGGAAFAGYSAWRGFRYPPVIYTLPQYAGERQWQGISVAVSDAIYLPTQDQVLRLRAYAPEPLLQLKATANSGETLEVFINNLHPQALVEVKGGVVIDHQVEATNHRLQLRMHEGEATVRWRFRNPKEYRFAVIGDTGAGRELQWCLTRAEQLGADFLLHLGDFLYGRDLYSQAIENFQQSPIPCYISIGNHDFHADGIIFEPFLEQLGVFNNVFELGGVRFVNLDTATDFFPPWAGVRGQMVKDLVETVASEQLSNSAKQTVIFTHRPLVEFRTGSHHDVNGIYEERWLTKQFLRSNTALFVAGHVHDRIETDWQGLSHVIAGQGLGHQDLLLGRLVSQMLVGDVIDGQPLATSWQPLNMPWENHCSDEHPPLLRDTGRLKMLAELEQLCAT